MKKVFAIFVSLIMLFSFAACEVDDTEENKTETKKSDLVGEYTSEAVEVEGKIYDPADLGQKYVIVLEEDGKGEFQTDREGTKYIEWKPDGDTIIFKGAEKDITASIKNGVIKMEDEGLTLWLVKEGASLPKEIKDNIVDEDELYGSNYEDNEIDYGDYGSYEDDETYDYYEDDETYDYYEDDETYDYYEDNEIDYGDYGSYEDDETYDYYEDDETYDYYEDDETYDYYEDEQSEQTTPEIDSPDLPQTESTLTLKPGTYVIYSLEVGGVLMNQSELSEAGYDDSYLVLGTDGYATMSIAGEVETGIIWNETSLSKNDEPIPMEWDGQFLKVGNDELLITFTK